MNAYLEYDPDVFRDKVILLPCDDPEWSNFTKFFALHFVDFGLKKLISTSYAPTATRLDESTSRRCSRRRPRKFDAAKTRANGKKFILEPKDINGDGVINIDDLQWEYLDGDGDFRSDEVTASARRGRHRHHQPAVQPLPRVRRLARRGRQEVLDHRQQQRDHLHGRLPAHQGTTSCGRARRRTAPTWCSASPRACR